MAALLYLSLTTAAAQTGEGAVLLAAFKAWQKTAAPAAQWSDALEQYRLKLVHDGRSSDQADRAIRLITAYDEAELYDSVYTKPPTFNTAPSRLLVDATRGVKPGRALDVGIGMGRNALHLARTGWDVTGFDVSSVGVRQAEAASRAEALRLTATVAADEEFDFGTSRWDLIALIFTIEKRSVHRVRDALRPGGLVVIEAGINPDPAAAFGYAPGELLKIFDGFEILTHEQAEGTYDWGSERIQLVRLVARKPSR
jgi:SAM-dependent methyltransferase